MTDAWQVRKEKNMVWGEDLFVLIAGFFRKPGFEHQPVLKDLGNRQKNHSKLI